ncbi:DNA-binding transcriptional MerR regulator [Microbacterium resistens]|uniref:DNA-binding transcriptional MerR regulator n=1 Tax=Microbacterium resistens TaxID=156977 RepID=A0ABU1SA25_9MICO|nr:MerR family transcriptional regulator [Microbacterium resistens]MDR6865672.1 DNA-binding transcriptional MerR regulator [Microbacterium resistens]
MNDKLTISQLAAYAGITVATVRHYHRIGLLPEPARDGSGYRRYDAAAVVRLIRIHVLASAGVPLAKVDDLLEAGPAEFADGVEQIDQRLRSEIRRLQRTRERLARLAGGEQIALPPSVIGYLDRLRAIGVDQRYLDFERDAWILVAAHVPDQIDSMMVVKHAALDDPDMMRLYSLLSGAIDWPVDDPRVIEVADILDRINHGAVAAGVPRDDDGFEDRFVDLLDTAMMSSAPLARRLISLLEERGWTGWTRPERISPD